MTHIIRLLLYLTLSSTVLSQGSGGLHPTTDRPPATGIFAGRYEARVGLAIQSLRENIRLDIGGSTILFRGVIGRDDAPNLRLAVGFDAFTWGRLRRAGGSGLLMETIDYYLGGSLSGRLSPSEPVNEFRMRLAYAASHRADGDPDLLSVGGAAVPYNRAVAEGLIANRFSLLPNTHVDGRVYGGVEALLASSPDTLQVFSFFAGGELTWEPWPQRSPSFRCGYQIRADNEDRSFLAHDVRAAVRLNVSDHAGLAVQGGYRTGRSDHGQYFFVRESTAWVGLGIDLGSTWLTTK